MQSRIGFLVAERKFLRALSIFTALNVLLSAGAARAQWHQFETAPASMPDIAFTAPVAPLALASLDHNDPSVAVVEFNEKGDLWPCDASTSVCQAGYAANFIKQARRTRPLDERLVVLTFVHGWTHNAAWDDQNFLHLREAVDCLNWGETDYQRVYANLLHRPQSEDTYDLRCEGVAAQQHVHYVGVYVGWQGTPANQSIDPVTTLIPVFAIAQTTAANPAMKNLMTQLGETAKVADAAIGSKAEFLVVGHSMGGLITERIASSMLTVPQNTLANPPCSNGRSGRTLPVDLFVLINPANNTGVGLDLISKMKAGHPCRGLNTSPTMYSPLIISIHSDTDIWTGPLGSIAAHIHSPFAKVAKADAPKNDKARSETPPERWRLNGRTFNQSPFLLNLCYLDGSSIRLDGDGSRTSDVVCDRVAEKVKEIKVAANLSSGLGTPLQPNGVDKGAYELLEDICDATAPLDSANACVGTKLTDRNKERDILNPQISPLLAFPKSNEGETPNVLFDLYVRNDPGCKDSNDPDVASRPLCDSINTHRQPVPIGIHPWNDSPYWAVNVTDRVIHGHSSFWSDQFTSLLLGLAENLQ